MSLKNISSILCYLIVIIYIKTNWYFFFNDTATTEIYTSNDTLSLHDALHYYHINVLKHVVNLINT